MTLTVLLKLMYLRTITIFLCGYQEFAEVESSVTTKVKGFAR